MGHHDQGGLLGGGALAWVQEDGIEVQAPCGGGVCVGVRAQQRRQRLARPPRALTVLRVLLFGWGLQGADAPADARHRGGILQADPPHLRLLAGVRQHGHFLSEEKGQCQHRGAGGR